MRSIYLLCSVSLVLSWNYPLAADDQGDAYLGTDPKAMFAALPITERQRAIDYLVRIISTADPSDLHRARAAAAARMLGQLQAGSAAEVLLRNIDLRELLVSRFAPLAQHPAAEALVEIGSPRYNDIFGYLGHDLPDRKLQLLAFVVHGIDGKEVGLFRVRHKLSAYEAEMREFTLKSGRDQTNQDYVRNLKRLIELFDGDFLDKPQNWPSLWR